MLNLLYALIIYMIQKLLRRATSDPIRYVTVTVAPEYPNN